jgi:hypothetical protein
MIDIISNVTSTSNITFNTDTNGDLECPQLSEIDDDVIEKTAFFIEGKQNLFSMKFWLCCMYHQLLYLYTKVEMIASNYLPFSIAGIFQTVVAIFGIIGNTMAALILSSRKRAKNTFDSLCVSLTCFDSVYLIGCILQSFRLQFDMETKLHLQLYPHLLSPIHQFSITASIFMTVAISLER